MILTLAVLAALLLAFAAPGLIAAYERRQRRRERGRSEVEPAWWPQFEREFHTYVRRLEAQRRHPGASSRDRSSGSADGA